MTFHVGQQVVCVNDINTVLVTTGTVYTINAVYFVPEHKMTYLALDAVKPGFPLRQRGMDCTRFRPVAKTDISIFTAMLNPAPEHETVP